MAESGVTSKKHQKDSVGIVPTLKFSGEVAIWDAIYGAARPSFLSSSRILCVRLRISRRMRNPPI